MIDILLYLSFEASAEADGGPAAAAADPVAAGPVVPGEEAAVDTPTTAAHCVGVRAVVTDIPVLGELTIPVPPGYTALANDTAGADEVEEDETTLPAAFWRMKVVAGVVVFALLMLLTVDNDDTGIKPTPLAVLTNAPLCPFAIDKGSWIKRGWIDTDWPPEVAGVLVMTPVLGTVFSRRVPVWDWPGKEVDEGVELVVVVMICRMGAGEASAEEVGVVCVDRCLGRAGLAEGRRKKKSLS